MTTIPKPKKAKIALIGTGKIGSRILSYLRQNAQLKVDDYDLHNFNQLADQEYDVVFLTTPMKAVGDLRKLISNQPLVITTIKGIYQNKLVCDFFDNVVSLNGYYTPQLFQPKFCLARKEEFIESVFPEFPKFEMDVRQALTANYLKNMYLVVSEKIDSERVEQDIAELEINSAAKELLREDLEMCRKLKSRNYLFSKMVYRDKIPALKAIRILGLVEGAESFTYSEDFASSLITEIREEFIRDLN